MSCDKVCKLLQVASQSYAPPWLRAFCASVCPLLSFMNNEEAAQGQHCNSWQPNNNMARRPQVVCWCLEYLTVPAGLGALGCTPILRAFISFAIGKTTGLLLALDQPALCSTLWPAGNYQDYQVVAGRHVRAALHCIALQCTAQHDLQRTPQAPTRPVRRFL